MLILTGQEVCPIEKVKQGLYSKCLAASLTEAEYMALFEAVREALWLKSLVSSIKVELTKPIKILEGNQGCICIANNPACHMVLLGFSLILELVWFDSKTISKRMWILNIVPRIHNRSIKNIIETLT